VIALFLHPASATALTLDSFSQALPPNPCLPLSNQPVVFTGSYCDGVACPPDPWVTCGQSEVTQFGLPGVIAGARRQVGVNTWTDEPVHARVDLVAHRLQIAFEGVHEAIAGVSYGTPGNPYPEPGALNLNLIALGATSVQVPLDGNLSPATPLLLLVEFLSDGDEIPRPSASATVVVQQPGIVDIPLAAFVPLLGFTMADVDDIEIWFGNCLDADNGCDGDATFPPMAFSVGPIEIVTPPTASRRSSWGHLKQLYR